MSHHEVEVEPEIRLGLKPGDSYVGAKIEAIEPQVSAGQIEPGMELIAKDSNTGRRWPARVVTIDARTGQVTIDLDWDACYLEFPDAQA